ncbi:hypothetical protein EUTSA_v10028145mg, partial [Eutrema salsugineum]
ECLKFLLCTGNGRLRRIHGILWLTWAKMEECFFLNDDCTLGELTEMARDDYNLDKKTELIELTYSLPDSMLQTMAPDTPPMHVTNDRQVSSLIALSRVHMVRLYVSSRLEMDTEENREGSDDDLGEESEENSEHSTDDEAASSDENEDGEEKITVSTVKNRYGETGSTPMSWSDNIYVRASFPTNDKLLSEVRLTAIMLKFAFKTEKSTKTLFVAKCRVEGCAWMVRASVKNDASTFWVTKYDSMKHMFGIKMDYTTSYRSWIYAQQLVRGTAEDGYAGLQAYLHSVNKANLETVAALHVDSNNKFKYIFLVFGASIAGSQYMRRVIVVDGCHLTGKYEGTLLVATAQDGNFQIFPLAFGIVDSEDDASWEWHLSIKKVCQTVFPWAKRGICYYHLQHNIVTKFKGKQLLYLVKRVAYAYNFYDYNRYMAELRQIKPEFADYLEETDISLWSRVHFVGDRYYIKTINVAESINVALKKACGYPISFLLDFIRENLGRWFLKRREDALSLTTHNTWGVEYLLAIRGYYADAMEVERIDTWKYYVKGGNINCLVDLENGMCECAALAGGIAVDSLVCPTYSKNYLFVAYSANIFPQISEVQGVQLLLCLPPDIRRKPGRRKKSRWQPWLEIARRKSRKPRKLHKLYSCSQCKQPGYTLPNCVS